MPWGCTSDVQRKPHQEAQTESNVYHWEHASTWISANLSFQITNFLPKFWTLSSSDKKFPVPPLGILTLRIRKHCSVPLNLGLTCYTITLPGITMIYTHILISYIIFICMHILFIYVTFTYAYVNKCMQFVLLQSNQFEQFYFEVLHTFIFSLLNLPVNETHDTESDD